MASPSTAPARAACDKGAILGFKGFRVGVEQLALRHDDDVVAWRNLVATEHLANQPFSAIPADGATQLLRGGDPEAPPIAAIRQEKDRGEPSVDPDAAVVDLLKLDAAPNPLFRPELRQLFAADRQPFPALRPPALQDQAAVLGAHPDEEAVRPLAVTRVRLKCALSLHGSPSRETELSILANRFVGCQLRRPPGCATVSGLPRDSPPAAMRAFGLSPEFSTPVEKTVENPRNPSSCRHGGPILCGSRPDRRR